MISVGHLTQTIMRHHWHRETHGRFRISSLSLSSPHCRLLDPSLSRPSRDKPREGHASHVGYSLMHVEAHVLHVDRVEPGR